MLRHLRLLVISLVLTLAGRASAQTITVTTTSTAETNDSVCTLPEAVKAINNQANYSGCTFAPTGSADRIVLNVSGSPDVFTISGAMTVSRTMEIAGQGQTATVISTGGIWGLRVSGGTLSLLDLTLQRKPDQPLPVTGIRVDGSTSLELDNVRVANFNQSGIIVDGDGPESTLVTIVDSIIENNTGSGLHNKGATVEIHASVIRGNTSLSKGGGIYNQASDGIAVSYVNVYDSVIENNTADFGGGIYSGDQGVSARVNVYRSLIRGNVADDSGGGYYSKGQFIINNTTVTGNWANLEGGGIYHAGAELQIQQCTIAGNGGTLNGITTLRGGGVFANGGQTLFIQSIFADNVSTFARDVSSPFGFGQSYNLIESASGAPGFGGTDLIGVDPLLGTLQFLGGPTMVLPLLAGSQAIDRIPSNVAPNTTTDQRGSPRQTSSGGPRDGDSTGVGYDIGAFEQGILESEFLTVAAKTAGVSHTLIADMAYAKSEGTRLNATLDGHFVTYAVPVLSTGTYSFRIRARRGTNRGIYQVATSNSSGSGFTNRGTPQDLYNASTPFTELTLGGATVNFTTTGTKYIRFTVTGRNASSSSRNLYLDWVQLVKQ